MGPSLQNGSPFPLAPLDDKENIMIDIIAPVYMRSLIIGEIATLFSR